MSVEITIVLVVLIGMLIALIADKMRPGMILFSAVVIFLCTGILSPKEMLEGFSKYYDVMSPEDKKALLQAMVLGERRCAPERSVIAGNQKVASAEKHYSAKGAGSYVARHSIHLGFSE